MRGFGKIWTKSIAVMPDQDCFVQCGEYLSLLFWKQNTLAILQIKKKKNGSNSTADAG